MYIFSQWKSLKKQFLFSVVVVMLLGFTSPASAQVHTSELQQIISGLLQQIEQLEKQIAQKNLKKRYKINPQRILAWDRNLGSGDTGEDVRQLQIFLNTDTQTRVASLGDGSPGNETDFFGPATARAVQRFQEKYKREVLSPNGLNKGSGYFGSQSRKKINQLSKSGTENAPNEEEGAKETEANVSVENKQSVPTQKSITKILSTSPPRVVLAPACNKAQMQKLLAPATVEADAYRPKCSPSLTSNDVITKRIFLERENASGVIFDCKGATLDGSSGTFNYGKDMILVRSGKVNGSWSRPEDITVRNCTVKGGMRVYGMGITGADPDVNASSKSLGHTERQQAAAPTRTTIENVTFIAQGRIPLFLSPGVTYTTVRNVTFAGRSNSTSVYLAAESGYNTFINNNFTINPKGTREVFAVDGSAYNIIKNNKFSGLNKGGIFLYRNCGESGTIRHQKPQYNEITGNEFYYNKYKGALPAIWLGSRTGNTRRYCGADAGYDFGSSIANGSFAENNIVTGNKIVKLSAGKMIRNSNPPNTISGNGTIAKRGDSLPPNNTVVTTTSTTICPRYQRLYCGEGEVVQSGTVGADGCEAAPQCISSTTQNNAVIKTSVNKIVDDSKMRKDPRSTQASVEENDRSKTEKVQLKIPVLSAITVGVKVISNNPHTAKNRLTVFFSGLRGVAKGIQGEVIAGPGNYGGNTWWRVKYENGLTAWSRSDRISVVEGQVLGVFTSRNVYAQLQSALSELSIALTKLNK